MLNIAAKFPESAIPFLVGALILCMVGITHLLGFLPNAQFGKLIEIWLWAMALGGLGSLVRVGLTWMVNQERLKNGKRPTGSQ